MVFFNILQFFSIRIFDRNFWKSWLKWLRFFFLLFFNFFDTKIGKREQKRDFQSFSLNIPPIGVQSWNLPQIDFFFFFTSYPVSITSQIQFFHGCSKIIDVIVFTKTVKCFRAFILQECYMYFSFRAKCTSSYFHLDSIVYDNSGRFKVSWPLFVSVFTFSLLFSTIYRNVVQRVFVDFFHWRIRCWSVFHFNIYFSFRIRIYRCSFAIYDHRS